VPLPRIHAFGHDQFSGADLERAKGATTVSVCLPARDEAATIGPIVAAIHDELVERHQVIDELLVIDDHSSDGTDRIAADAGATVVDAASVLPEFGAGHGKGEALWKSLFAARGDVVVWCDADIRDFSANFITGLVGPLLTRDDVDFVKGHYSRTDESGRGRGGRVTELVARPLLGVFFPELAEIVQPLSGEYGGRRPVLERLPFVQGYGVDLGLLIDVAGAVGVERMAQVDLGARVHRNRPIDELSPQALAVLLTALRRADPGLVSTSAVLRRPDLDPTPVSVAERPPLLEVPGYLRRSA
jgi:glucosyl-3-phosphoglycerate synthase